MYIKHVQGAVNGIPGYTYTLFPIFFETILSILYFFNLIFQRLVGRKRIIYKIVVQLYTIICRKKILQS